MAVTVKARLPLSRCLGLLLAWGSWGQAGSLRPAPSLTPFLAPVASGGQPRPTHLVVLAHGLGGTSNDLARLSRLLSNDRDILTLAVRSNEGRTRDGVSEGSGRVAREVTAAVAANPSLQRISFVGNSLGGLYIRHTARLMYERGSFGRGAKIAGLWPEAFITIASPHLGTRLLPWCPPALQATVAPFVAGRTASDLFLQTRMLSQMTDESHLIALASFRRRVLFANEGADLMVQRHTSALDGEHRGLGRRERLMASRLRTLSWRTVTVRFPWLPFPIAHNMICGLNRGPVSAFVYRRGLAVMEEAAETIRASHTQPLQEKPTQENFIA
ncbi:putative serine esterase-domain-containing protein [Pavlovales sp. CCMP2436]|nr:putative serine esterase-domain-containing protein [Pavlovales sp. CCMP2436]